MKNKQEIQKTTGSQLLVLLAFVAFIVLLVYLMNASFSEMPYDLLRVEALKQSNRLSLEFLL